MAGKSTKSKFFRVATEGATTDGRKIERKWLQEIAATYNQAKYGARIFIEHIRGINPNSEWGFRCMGDVVAVKAEEVEDGKLALFAQIDPTPEMVKMVGERQKIYSSIEVAENFANTGMAYLMGLGVTDSPASLGTEILAFAAQNPDASPFTTRKQAPGNLFTRAEESLIEFEEVEDDDKPSLFARVKELFAQKRTSDNERFADVHQAVEEIATATASAVEAAEQGTADIAELGDKFAALEKTLGETATTVADLKLKLDHTDDSSGHRPAATGNSAAVVTDC